MSGELDTIPDDFSRAGLVAAVDGKRAMRWWAEESFVSADAVAGTARTWGTWRVAP